jgi:hypothetical protein
MDGGASWDKVRQMIDIEGMSLRRGGDVGVEARRRELVSSTTT